MLAELQSQCGPWLSVHRRLIKVVPGVTCKGCSSPPVHYRPYLISSPSIRNKDRQHIATQKEAHMLFC